MEEIRAATQELRLSPSLEPARRLRDRLSSLELSKLRTLTRAFSLYFDLINLAEQRARVRVLRRRAEDSSEKPLSDTPDIALGRLKDRGVTAEQLAGVLQIALVLPVFTAHPSEARRRTVLEKLDAIARQFDRLEYVRLVPSERAQSLDAIAAQIETFWLTDIVRDHRPTVLDEIRHGLGMVCDTLFEIVPQVYRESRRGAGPNVSRIGRPGPAVPALRLVDWRRPRREPQCHARRDARRGPAPPGDDFAVLRGPGRRAGAAAQLFTAFSEARRRAGAIARSR